jgi:hypothetical protein
MVMDCFMELMEVVEGRGVHGHELLHGTHRSRGRKGGRLVMDCFMKLMEVVEGRVDGHELLHGTHGRRGWKVCGCKR